MKKFEYLKLDMLLYAPEGATQKEHDKFADIFIELVESFGWQAGGGFHSLDEKEVEELSKE